MKKNLITSAALIAAISSGYLLGSMAPGYSVIADTLRGDVNGDGVINIVDFIELKSILLGTDKQSIPEEPVQLTPDIFKCDHLNGLSEENISAVITSSEDVDSFLEKLGVETSDIRNTFLADSASSEDLYPDESDYDNYVYLYFTSTGSYYEDIPDHDAEMSSSSIDVTVRYHPGFLTKYIFRIKICRSCYNNQELNLQEIPVPYNEGEPVPCKPVIYLYPEETTDINVKVNINNTGRLTYTYPLYNPSTGWSVTAEPDSVLHDSTGREYSYLFWEGVSDQKWDMTSGFVVKGSDTVAFLQEKLEYLGLTPREYNEFIVYWMPRMQDNEYNLITFQTDKYEEYAELEITPEPDSIQRVFMAYEPLDEYTEIPEQELQPFERSGYSVIEWGGVEISDDIYTIK